jgi:arylsulfatase
MSQQEKSLLNCQAGSLQVTATSSLSRACGAIAAGLLLAATMVVASPAQAQAPARKPNILVIMGDDVGWFNIGAYSRGIMSGKTPNLDQLA